MSNINNIKLYFIKTHFDFIHNLQYRFTSYMIGVHFIKSSGETSVECSTIVACIEYSSSIAIRSEGGSPFGIYRRVHFPNTQLRHIRVFHVQQTKQHKWNNNLRHGEKKNVSVERAQKITTQLGKHHIVYPTTKTNHTKLLPMHCTDKKSTSPHLIHLQNAVMRLHCVQTLCAIHRDTAHLGITTKKIINFKDSMIELICVFALSFCRIQLNIFTFAISME